jgi:hypothetical protein
MLDVVKNKQSSRSSTRSPAPGALCVFRQFSYPAFLPRMGRSVGLYEVDCMMHIFVYERGTSVGTGDEDRCWVMVGLVLLTMGEFMEGAGRGGSTAGL